MEKTLHLTLKKKWFEMIASGEKKEEYRELKEFWNVRFSDFDIVSRNNYSVTRKFIGFKWFDTVTFRNGYAKDSPTIVLEFKGIEIGNAKSEWSDGWGGEVFIVKLGEIINRT